MDVTLLFLSALLFFDLTMAGAGRRSQYRKHLTDAVLNDLPEPSATEQIARVVATRGGNQFDIVTAAAIDQPKLAILPTKFHKLVWVKRNDYVIVESGTKDGGDNDDDDIDGHDQHEENGKEPVDVPGGNGGIRFIINHILYKEQIRHLVGKKLWPPEFGDSAPSSNGAGDDDDDNNNAPSESDNKSTLQDTGETPRSPSKAGTDEPTEDESATTAVQEDGIVYNEYSDDDLMFVNTNRMTSLRVEDSESDSDDD